MTSVLMRLFVDDLTGYEPTVVDLESPMTIVGISVDTTLRRIYRAAPRVINWTDRRESRRSR